MKLNWIISIPTGILIIYMFSVGFEVDFSIIFGLLVLLNFSFFWMIIRILKYEKPPEKSFEHYFYEDWDYKRNNPE